MTKKSEIHITVEMDENNVPTSMKWSASDGAQGGDCRAFFMSIWDEKEKNSMHLHLWTKEMLLDEMKQFMHQALLSQADTLKKAVADEKLAESLYDYAHEYALKAGILKNIK
jgi:gliding motility-associated protein GldC